MASLDNTNYELLDDTGTKRYPPITYFFELTGLKDGTEIRIHKTSDGTAVVGVEDMTGGTGTDMSAGVTVTGSTNDNTFTYTYDYTADIDIYVVILNLQYQIMKISGQTITESNSSIPISQIIDRNYSNPI